MAAGWPARISPPMRADEPPPASRRAHRPVAAPPRRSESSRRRAVRRDRRHAARRPDPPRRPEPGGHGRDRTGPALLLRCHSAEPLQSLRSRRRGRARLLHAQPYRFHSLVPARRRLARQTRRSGGHDRARARRHRRPGGARLGTPPQSGDAAYPWYVEAWRISRRTWPPQRSRSPTRSSRPSTARRHLRPSAHRTPARHGPR